jgi:thiamine-phosphate pyrophosphorylase
MIDNKETNFVRLIDANLNRLKEGVRVIEDIARYHDNNPQIAKTLKALRHKAKIEERYRELLSSRDSQNDVLRTSTTEEMKREDIQSVLIANYKRAQESARVLEEVTKIWSARLSENFKNIRYQLYALEKEHLLD